jgi:transcriptional regulator with XRE-family HTH domain
MRFRIKTLARTRGWTLEELAFHSGVKYSTVKNLWQGRTKNPSYGTLRALAHALGVSVEQLEAQQEAQENETPVVSEYVRMVGADSQPG